MGYEATILPAKEASKSLYTYETVETLSPIRAAMEGIHLSGIEQVALVIIKLYYEQDYRDSLARQSSAYLLNILRPLVRKTDNVFLLDTSMVFVLRAANQEGGAIVQTRLWEALLWGIHNMTERELLRPRSMTIGHSSYSEADVCIEAAYAVSLRYDWQPEKSSRKPARHSQLQQLQADETEEIEVQLPALARKLGIPFLMLLPRKTPAGVQRLVNPQLAQELHCVPVGRERNMLTVAMLNPQDRTALDRLRQETGLLIFPVLTHPETLQHALEQLV
jgi:hypothetical protein